MQVTVCGANCYVLFDPASGEVVHGTETSLGGVLLDPSGLADARLPGGRRRWVEAVHAGLLPGGQLPSFCQELAVSGWRASTPEQLAWLRALPGMAEAQPFTQFMLAHPSKLVRARPGKRAHGDWDAEQAVPGSPIAAFNPNPAAWPKAIWCRRDGGAVQLVRSDNPSVADGYVTGPTTFVAATVAEVVNRTWRTGIDVGARPVALSRPVAPMGVVRWPPAEALDDVVLVGREGDKMLDEACGVLVDPAARLTVYSLPGDYVLDVRS
ncbi:MAG TPA: hypothetical protein VED59_03100, partial [Acidimicrobiales bacterium]|nr:hypothetical protein [Acidimicrobiales bacterium]